MGNESPKKPRGRGNRKATIADDQAEAGWKARRAEIMRLRISEGLTQAQIAERLGMHQSQVSTELARIREEWKPENVDELREIANARLEKIWRAQELTLDDPQSANAAIKAIAEHAKLNGLHAPEKKEIIAAQTVTVTPATAREAMRRAFGDVTPTGGVEPKKEG